MIAMASARAIPSVGAVLAVVHDHWNAQIGLFLAPATDVHSDLWGRWDAARFLSDQFQDRFRLECALAEKLGELIGPAAAQRLANTRAEIDRTSEELMSAGRRRGLPELTAALARRLIEEVARWCVELEMATSHLAPGALPLDARRVLARLRVADALAG
jgi:hypothetical protein